MKLQVLVPPLPEQRAIAEALSDVDGLLGGLDRLIAKKRDLKQAAMQQLLTGQTRLPGFHGEWEVKRLGEVAMLKNGYAFKSDTYTSLGTFKIITIASVQDGYMTTDACNTIADEPADLQPHQRLRRGDILISMTGNVGRVCRVNEDHCLLNQRVGKLVPVGVIEALLFVLLGQPSFISAMTGVAKGGAQPNLSASDITEHTFNIPKDEAEQTAIAEVLSEMDGELAVLEQRREKTRALKQAMMQELLTGRTRLV
jgi:type I restriction enzyme S subunit